MKNKTLYLFGLLCSMMASNNAVAAASCEELAGYTLEINANGFHGVTYTGINGIILSQTADGTYTFSTAIKFENAPVDTLIGTCKNRYITLTRIKNGNSIQQFEGWIFTKNDGGLIEMAGLFAYKGMKKYAWCAHTGIVPPF